MMSSTYHCFNKVFVNQVISILFLFLFLLFSVPYGSEQLYTVGTVSE